MCAQICFVLVAFSIKMYLNLFTNWTAKKKLNKIMTNFYKVRSWDGL